MKRTGPAGRKSVELGTNDAVSLPWLTSLETPVAVLQRTGAPVERDGRAVRHGAEGMLAALDIGVGGIRDYTPRGYLHGCRPESRMSLMEWSIIAGAVVTIAWVNWYFFVAGRTPALAAVPVASGGTGASIAEVVITVDGGYSPNTVRVQAGQPVRLVFDRKDDSSCSEEVVIPEFGVRRFLPTGERTVIEVTPPAAGSYPFTCGMSMLRGTIIAGD